MQNTTVLIWLTKIFLCIRAAGKQNANGGKFSEGSVFDIQTYKEKSRRGFTKIMSVDIMDMNICIFAKESEN